MSSQVAAGLASGFLDEETNQPYEDVISFDDEEEVDDAPSSAKQERIRQEAAVYEQKKSWLEAKVNELRANPHEYARKRALFKRWEKENQARVTALDKDDPYRVTYENYQYAAKCRMLELKSKLPDSITAEQLQEMIAYAEDHLSTLLMRMVLLREMPQLSMLSSICLIPTVEVCRREMK